MNWRAVFIICMALICSMISTRPALADGIIIPEPPICMDGPCPPIPCLIEPCPPRPHLSQLVIRYHHVTVTIEDQLAVTHVDQVFYNPNDWQIEGEYVFPIPKDAAVSNFVLWIDGKPVKGQVLEAGEARKVYEEIVRSIQDPALLEYADRGALRARIFPIPPQGERRIELEYTQALPSDNNLVQYSYPLNTEKFSLLPLEEVSISVSIRSSRASIRAVYSPSHTLDVVREDEHEVSASYEAGNIRPDKDFSLFYSLGDEQAFHLLTYRNTDDREDADGFFLLLLAASPELPDQALPKDVILVLDRSGSMEGEKFQQAQEALRYMLNHLSDTDRFNLITFSSGVELFSPRLEPARKSADALKWVDRLSAAGSTDINRALLEAAAVADRERPTYIIFLTDGLPTSGVTDSERILSNFSASARDNLRLFVFGVGYDVDTYLLDSLSQEHHGLSTYVRPGEQLFEILSGFYARISTPVMTNLELDFGDIPVYDLYPDPLPDMFAGSQIVLVGRYRRSGTADILLRGEIGEEEKVLEYRNMRFIERSQEDPGEPLTAIPYLWAVRKIGWLLNQVRLQGPDQETIDQIVRLSIRYGIVTPYTSYLVTEDAPLGEAQRQRIAEREFNLLQATAAPAVSGAEAVGKAADQSAMAQADSVSAPAEFAADIVRVVGARTFVYKQNVWMDTTYDPGSMSVNKVDFLSDAYFSIVRQRPDAAAAFALGPEVLFVIEGEAYQVVASGGISDPVQISAPAVTENWETTPEVVEPAVVSTLVKGADPIPATGEVGEDGSQKKPEGAPVGGLCAGVFMPLAVLGLAVLSRKR